jgi:UDP-3-O-acyl-N-acetylglucosamine deacetylase
LQTTLENSVTFSGVGLHSGILANLTMKPAPVNHGILFKRVDVVLGNPLV